MTGILYLEDGSVYRGKGFGAAATKVGELVFNTSMSGYQEILTDPVVAGQVVNMTYPLIGNYGVSEIDNQSERIHVFGLIARDISFRPSNRCSVMGISEWLEEQGVPGIYNVDTRAITKKIRSRGTCKCVISNEGISKEKAQKLIYDTELKDDFIKSVSVEKSAIIPASSATGLKVATLDLGVRRSTLAALTGRGCETILFPHDAAPEEILSVKPDGLLLTDGPGDPAWRESGIETVKELMSRLPVFGIGMGHLMIALAAGGKVYKLKYGHRGGNHGVIDAGSGKSVITSQNHGYAIDAISLRSTGLTVSHINLNDGTVEGTRHKDLPVFSIAYAPEGVPGPCDSVSLYDRFVDMMLDVKSGSTEGGGHNA